MRKTDTIVIPKATKESPNRDAGKIFLLTEMSASRAEKFAVRVMMALAAQGLADPADARDGMAGLASRGTDILSGLSFDVLEPLMDEMMECVTVAPDPSKKDGMGNVITRPLIDMDDDSDDIEEVSTRVMLRAHLLDLHTGFSVAAFLSRMGSAAKSRISTTLTSPGPSEA